MFVCYVSMCVCNYPLMCLVSGTVWYLIVLFYDLCFLLYYLCVYYLHVIIDFVHRAFISNYLQKFALANKEDLYDMLHFIRLGMFCKDKRNRHAVPYVINIFL